MAVMSRIRSKPLCLSVCSTLALISCGLGLRTPSHNPSTNERAFNHCAYQAVYPRHYTAYKTTALSASSLDGDLSKPVWADVAWTEDFVDISTQTVPKHKTRAKLRWDDNFLYVAAEMEEPNVWATLVEHDSVIFQDNDFEVFVDAGGTTHSYKEFEVNAFNTTWDLCLNRPYGDAGYENSSRRFGSKGWDMQPPLRSAVKVDPPGVINDPSTPNTRWTVEIALPLRELMYNSTTKKPKHGSIWRINFSRVQWHLRVDSKTNKYVKEPSCQSCPSPGGPHEDNWVWSPQGEISMHLPERWAILQFSDMQPNTVEAETYAEWPSRAAAMAVYYAEHAYAKKHNGMFTSEPSKLSPYSAPPFELCPEALTNISLTADGFSATVVSPSGDGFAATVTQERFLTVASITAAE